MASEATFSGFPAAVNKLERDVRTAERECKFLTADGALVINAMRGDIEKAKKWLRFCERCK